MRERSLTKAITMCLQAPERLSNAKGIQMNFIEVQGTFLCTRWSTTHRNHFLCDLSTCCPVGYDQTIVYPEDSAWIEEQARWCKCNLCFPSCRSWNRWKRLCQDTTGIYSVFKEWSPKDFKLKNALYGHSLELSGNTSLRSSKRADWNNPNWSMSFHWK